MVANHQGTIRFPTDASRARPRARGFERSTQPPREFDRGFQHPSPAPSPSFLGKTITPAWKLTSTDHRPQQFSVVAISNASGSVVERVAYTAFGQPTFTNASGSALSSSAKATRYTYTGREWDSSLQLHHFRARWMSGVSGRFVGRDPESYLGSYIIYELFSSKILDRVDAMGTVDVDIDSCRHPEVEVSIVPRTANEVRYIFANFTGPIPLPHAAVHIPIFDFRCTCRNCGECNPCWLNTNCKIEIRHFIVIDEKRLKGTDFTVTGAIGHEQRHVLNDINFVLNQMQPTFEEYLNSQTCVADEDGCLSKTIEIENAMTRFYCHHYHVETQHFGVPEDGEPYDILPGTNITPLDMMPFEVFRRMANRICVGFR